MHILLSIIVSLAGVIFSVGAFVIPQKHTAFPSVSLDMAGVGIFYGTSTGSTEDVADRIKDAFGDDADGPFDVDALEGSVTDNFEKYDAIICGTPTWNTGADTERSGTGWDEIYYTSMSELNIEGKHVAVFGCGDQSSYAENFADATGELHDVFENLGCKMFGYTSQEGYDHEDSKSIRGEKFCGLLCDAVNQDELTGERVLKWVQQLEAEGFVAPSSSTEAVSIHSISSSRSDKAESTFEEIEEFSNMLDETMKHQGKTDNGFKSYYNEKTRSTMFVSSDGRSCYYTADPSGTAMP
jgi:flavodoxin I